MNRRNLYALNHQRRVVEHVEQEFMKGEYVIWKREGKDPVLIEYYKKMQIFKGRHTCHIIGGDKGSFSSTISAFTVDLYKATEEDLFNIPYLQNKNS